MENKKNRCSWCEGETYINNITTKSGVFLYVPKCSIPDLRTFQAGLSWITVLKKRLF